MESRLLSFLVGVVFIPLSSIAAGADIIIDGASSGVIITGTSGDATINAFSSANEPGKETFSNEILNYPGKSDPNVVVGDSILMSDVPIYTIDGITYLRLIYDAQETNNNEQIDITSILITVGDIDVWGFSESIIVNPDGNHGTLQTPDFTITPLSQGADLAVLIPMAIFDGLDLTGSDNFVLSASQTNSDNGPDEWAFKGYEGDDIGYIEPGEPISPVPIPAAAWLFGSALFITGAIKRRKA